MKNKNAKVVSIHDVNIDKDYVSWIEQLKSRYRGAQIKAAVKVNAEQLRFNWELGRDLVLRKAEQKWGSGVVEQISLDLQASFPESNGFSVVNLRRMRKWYLFYFSETEKLYQLGGEMKRVVNQGNIKRSQLVTVLQDVVEYPEVLGLVPWGHHVEIIFKCKSIDEAIFYLKRTIIEGWSRSTLVNCIKSDLYHSSGKAITNFAENLPERQRELAQVITKDTYDFGFLSLAKGYKEEALETELERHLTRFLLELGTGFAYLGRQKQIVVAGKTRKLDMLFFHIQLNCYVVIELKSVPFEPEFVGKLNFYVNAVDDLIKTPAQNPTIGLLICSNKEETEVQYAFKGLQTPMGVASYTNVQIKQIKEQLPSVEELTKRIRLLEEQL